MDKEKGLQDIFENDPLGLLNIKPSIAPSRNEDERLVASFQELNSFYEKNNRVPEQGGGLQEHQLYARLKSLRENKTKIAILNVFDKYGLLKYVKKEIKSLDDILTDDPLGLLGGESEGLFDLKHVVPTDIERVEADFVARRRPCRGFDKYEPRFKEVQNQLAAGSRKLVAFKQEYLRPGEFYVHNGVVLLLENVDFEEEVKGFRSGNRVRKDGRTRVVFENGTESNMLYLSLYKALLANGKAMTRTSTMVNYEFASDLGMVAESEDEEGGYIYILKSKSERTEIKEMHHLYKIGFSKGTVEERTKEAKSDPTYLMADVRIVMTFRCYNLNPQKFELLIHKFFGSACLDVDVIGEDGKRYSPREWFIAPLDVIEQAIHMIISGKIVNHRYDSTKSIIVLR